MTDTPDVTSATRGSLPWPARRNDTRPKKPTRRPGALTRGAWAIVLATLITTACVSPRPRVMPDPGLGPPLRVQLADSGEVVTIPLEEYVGGSVLAEADFRGLDEDEASRVAELQAILARTYALANRHRHRDDGFELCATTHCQVFRATHDVPPRLARVVETAVARTTGVVVTHADRPINALFHADCGGATSDASVPWGGAPTAYLQGVNDPYCLRDNPGWRFEAPLAEVQAALAGDDRTDVGARLSDIRITRRDPTGRAVMVTMRGARTRTVRGEVLRTVLVRHFGMRSVRSTRVTIERHGPTVRFVGRGFGHGVGLCQRGAANRVRAGHRPPEILQHYYPGAALTQYY